MAKRRGRTSDQPTRQPRRSRDGTLFEHATTVRLTQPPRNEAMATRESASFPESLELVLKRLSKLEKEIRPENFETGERMLQRTEFSVEDEEGSGNCNVIPSGRRGVCRPFLIVAIGASSSENLEDRLQQALEHVSSHCRAKTRYIIFWTLKWDVSSWNRYARSFEQLGIVAIRKLKDETPWRLCPAPPGPVSL